MYIEHVILVHAYTFITQLLMANMEQKLRTPSKTVILVFSHRLMPQRRAPQDSISYNDFDV